MRYLGTATFILVLGSSACSLIDNGPPGGCGEISAEAPTGDFTSVIGDRTARVMGDNVEIIDDAGNVHLYRMADVDPSGEFITRCGPRPEGHGFRQISLAPESTADNVVVIVEALEPARFVDHNISFGGGSSGTATLDESKQRLTIAMSGRLEGTRQIFMIWTLSTTVGEIQESFPVQVYGISGDAMIELMDCK